MRENAKETKGAIYSRSIIIDLLLIFLLSMLPFQNLLFRPGFIWRLDMAFAWTSFSFLQSISSQFFTWDPWLLFGRDGSSAGLFYIVLLWAIPSIIGFSPELIAKAVLVLIFVISGWAMYYLTLHFTEGDRAAGLISSIVYIFNPWIIDRALWGHLFILMTYSLSPLTLALYAKGVASNRTQYVLVAGIVLSQILVLEARTAMMLFIPLMIYSLFFLIFERRSRKNVIRVFLSLALILSVTLIVNIHVFLPSAMSIEKEIFSRGSKFSEEDVYLYSKKATIENVLRMRRYVFPFFTAMEAGAWGLPPLILNPVWYALTFLEPLIAFSAIIFCRKNKPTVFFITLVAISLFLCMGANTPFGIYMWLYRNVPFFLGFRDPNKFVALNCLAYAYLVGVSTVFIIKRLLKYSISIKITKQSTSR